MIEKPDDETWYEYLYTDEISRDERSELRDEWRELMADEAREILEDSELDESRYEVEVTTNMYVGADDEWLMDDREDAKELRDVLDREIGDESVGAFVTPRSSEGEIADIPEPDHVPVDEYEVFVELEQVQESIDGGLQAAKEKMNEAVGSE
ncbi:hypothetical protein [Halopiger xanaduensis]|uniref:Uncharacterized protein n=1 Tax=Halopiger xanaduensis (strain DSM 18323 / JCM 14033 / SH-6) TaxID=797210 RepID=F8D8G3_HALXS|nr:hypothetical protein [Halopiger xanaduensis]AEH35586.1 hypothetical protein Halxa_0950 [Halopiger xanaduensis SH-6]